MRRTKIVATVGPASRSREQLERLVLAGVNVFRLNFSHGTHEEHLAVIGSVREIAARLHRPIALLQDLSGPKIRTGRVRDGVLLVNGARLAITTDISVEGSSELVLLASLDGRVSFVNEAGSTGISRSLEAT